MLEAKMSNSQGLRVVRVIRCRASQYGQEDPTSGSGASNWEEGELKAIELAEEAFEEAMRQGADDVSALCSKGGENLVRFSNNSITLTNSTRSVELFLYVTKERRRIIGATSNLSPEGIKRFIADLVKACRILSPSPDYTPLPKGPWRYAQDRVYDMKVAEDGVALVDLAKASIGAAFDAGAERVSGTLTASEGNVAIVTSGGAKGESRGTKVILNVRAFADEVASGHGLSCTEVLSDLDPIGAGQRAGEYAKEAINPGHWEEGEYDLVALPTVAADIVQHVGSLASAFAVDTGLSFLADKIGQKVAIDGLTIRDIGVVEGGIGGRAFDDEGLPTQENIIVERGVLKGYLHNSTTARKFGASSTANAGIIDPHPWNLIVDAGSYHTDDLIKEVRRGVLVTNNWYTRFQNLRTGEYSTLPRDATFLIENGKIKHPIMGLRISDSIPRQLNNIHGISKERRWVEWWEVSIPTLTPALLIKSVTVTKAVT